jgi:tRNA(Ile)-lysidine synthase
MLSRVLRTIGRQQLLGGPGGDRILCAVSGGPDSMALLGCLWELAPRLHLTLEVATVDHGLRAEAAGEAALVQERCAALGVPWHCVRVDVAGARGSHLHPGTATAGADGIPRRPQGRAASGGGTQEVARRLRLGALTGLAAERGLGSVALGHHADDQAETVLFRILRGTGLDGLRGIPYRRAPFIRPLLDVTRAEILQYLHRRSLPFVTDPSNADARYARARLRHQILPILRQENPRIDQALRSLSAMASAHHPAGGRGRDPIERVLDQAVEAGIFIPTRLAAEIAAVSREGHGTRSFDVGGGAKVLVSYGRVSVEHGRRSPAGAQSPPPDPIRIPGPGWYAFGRHLAIVIHEALGGDSGASVGYEDRGFVWFDGESLAWPLSVRSRQRGDRMRPRAGRGSRKLSDLLIDAKIPGPHREALPVVVAADGALLWVPGLRPSRTAEPSTTTRRRIGLAVVPISDHDPLVDPPINDSNTETRGFPTDR